jgi:hypothetical protein
MYDLLLLSAVLASLAAIGAWAISWAKRYGSQHSRLNEVSAMVSAFREMKDRGDLSSQELAEVKKLTAFHCLASTQPQHVRDGTP